MNGALTSVNAWPMERALRFAVMSGMTPMALKDTGVALCTALALSVSPVPGFAQSNLAPQATAPATEQPVPLAEEEPVPLPEEQSGSSTPGSVFAGSAAGVAVVLVLVLGSMFAWSEGW